MEDSGPPTPTLGMGQGLPFLPLFSPCPPLRTHRRKHAQGSQGTTSHLPPGPTQSPPQTPRPPVLPALPKPNTWAKSLTHHLSTAR